VQILRFADDIVEVGESEENITNMLEKKNKTFKEHYLKINQRKIKVVKFEHQESTYKKLCVKHSSIWNRDLDNNEG